MAGGGWGQTGPDVPSPSNRASSVYWVVLRISFLQQTAPIQFVSHFFKDGLWCYAVYVYLNMSVVSIALSSPSWNPLGCVSELSSTRRDQNGAFARSGSQPGIATILSTLIAEKVRDCGPENAPGTPGEPRGPKGARRRLGGS